MKGQGYFALMMFEIWQRLQYTILYNALLNNRIVFIAVSENHLLQLSVSDFWSAVAPLCKLLH